MRLLFFKQSLAWPRSSGHDVHCFNMMKALHGLGAEISLATIVPPEPAAIDGVPLASQTVLPAADAATDGTPVPRPRLTRPQERFRSYFGATFEQIDALRLAARDCGADAVIAVGLDVLPHLAGIDSALRVWYAADEWVYHHLSRVRLTAPASWSNLTKAVVKGAYERAYRSAIDRVWVVAETERRAARWFAGMSAIDVLPNGVDADYYRAPDEIEIPNSAAFWGRLDFGPNVEALNWFCRGVWPAVRRAVPDARFTIIGFHPIDEVRRLAAIPGITVTPDVMDLRTLVSRHAIVVLPFVSGGGIKNKLLEAAALGKPIVCTPHACKGLRSSATELPLVKAITPHDWVAGMLALWADTGRRRQLGAEARDWVVRCHSWATTAREALDALEGARRYEDGACRSTR